MLKVYYKPAFIRMYNKLPVSLQNEVVSRIELFKDTKNHKLLDVHKLHGKLRKYYGFSVDYNNRVVFDYLSGSEAVLFAVGDHDVYK